MSSRRCVKVVFVNATSTVLPDLDTLDAETLKALVIEKQAVIVEQHAALSCRDAEIENLKLLILKLRRMQFGQRSEKLDQQIDQLELQLEDLEAAASLPRPEPPVDPQSVVSTRPVRGPLSAQLPRETETLKPVEDCCLDCVGALGFLGEDVSETLEYVPARFKVIRTVRPKLSCTRCDRIVQQPSRRGSGTVHTGWLGRRHGPNAGAVGRCAETLRPGCGETTRR